VSHARADSLIFRAYLAIVAALIVVGIVVST
jgi:hypothetical protein